jgi:hypothetical protein
MCTAAVQTAALSLLQSVLLALYGQTLLRSTQSNPFQPALLLPASPLCCEREWCAEGGVLLRHLCNVKALQHTVVAAYLHQRNRVMTSAHNISV